MGEGRESDLARMDNSNGNKLGGGGVVVGGGARVVMVGTERECRVKIVVAMRGGV